MMPSILPSSIGVSSVSKYCDPVALAQAFYAVEKTSAPVFDADNYYLLDENMYGLTALRFFNDGEDLTVQFSNGSTHFGVRAGAGKWLHNRFTVASLASMMPGLSPVSEQTRGIAASFTWKDGVLTLTLRSLSQPHRMDITITFEGGEVTAVVGKAPMRPGFSNILKGKQI